jgi:hypothetical protein
MNKINLTERQFAVGKAEFSTGIALKNDGSYFHKGDSLNETFEIFESFDEAKKFVVRKVTQEPTIECYITNYKNETVFAYDKDGERYIGKKEITNR